VDGGWWLTRGGSGGVGEVVVGFGLCNFMLERITSSLLTMALGLPGSEDRVWGHSLRDGTPEICIGFHICTSAFLRL